MTRLASMGILVLLWIVALVPSYAQQPPWSRAQALLKEGKPGDALPILLELHSSEPSNANLCQQIGIAYTQLQQLDRAESFYREAVRLNPQFWAARKNLGTVLWFLDRRAESEREFQAVTKALPADPVPHLYLGLAANGRREFLTAKMQFEKSGARAFENPEVLPAVVESFLGTRDLNFPAKIEEQLNRAADSDPALTARLAALFMEYGHADRASSAIEKLLSAHDGSAEIWRLLAESYDRQGNPEKAYRAYSRAIDADANSDDAYIALAEFASAHGNDDYALQVVGRGLEHRPQSPALFFERGILWVMKGDRKQAEDSFGEAGRLKPEWALPFMALGVSKLESGDAAQARAAFQKARAIDASDFRVHYLYATALARDSRASAENRTEAISALREAIRLNPQDGRSHALLGQLELEAGKPLAAAAEWQTALKIEPENATALYQLGLLYQKQGKAAEAKRLLEAFRVAKAKMHGSEESLVQILRVAADNSTSQRPMAARDASTRAR